jgi:hypothetical protein
MIAALLLAAAICPTCINPAMPDAGPIPCVREEGPAMFTDRATFVWPMWDANGTPTPAIAYDVVRGVIGAWPGTVAVCEAKFYPYLHEPAADPPPGTGYWWLVRGYNVCGSGTWGASSAGERVVAACGP